MVEDLEDLEKLLRELGNGERELEDAVRELPKQSRTAALGGDLDKAAAIWKMREEASEALAKLQKRILAVEARLYGLRRRKQ